MTRVLHGRVRGRTIELDSDPGIPEGAQVELLVKEQDVAAHWGEGIRRSAGGWADHPELDQVMEALQQERKHDRRDQIAP